MVKTITITKEKDLEVLEKKPKKKLGKGQKNQLLRTLGLICYTLKIEGPLTAFGIHRKTGIHRTFVLPRSLYNLEEQGVVIKKLGKGGLYYYELNWEHDDAAYFLFM